MHLENGPLIANIELNCELRKFKCFYDLGFLIDPQKCFIACIYL